MKKKLPPLENTIYALTAHIKAASDEVTSLSGKMGALQKSRNDNPHDFPRKQAALAKKIEAHKVQLQELEAAAKIITKYARKTGVLGEAETPLPELGFESVNAPETKIMRILFNRRQTGTEPVGTGELSGLISLDMSTTEKYLSALDDEGLVCCMTVKNGAAHKDACIITEFGSETVWRDFEKFGIKESVLNSLPVPVSKKVSNGRKGRTPKHAPKP